MNAFEKINVDIKLSFDVAINRDNKFQIGPGVISLCKLIDECGSLSAATKQLSMAYSKAWRIIKHAENSLGYLLVERNGKAGSNLTCEGKKLVAAYLDLREQTCQFVNEKFEEIVQKI